MNSAQPDELNLIFAPAPLSRVAARAKRRRAIGAASVVAPIAAALAAGVLVGATNRRALGAGVLGVALGLGLARWQLARLVTEQPPYTVEKRTGPLEIRRYAPQLLAQTIVRRASWDWALAEGFRRVAAYLFGANDATSKIPMTAPVLASLPAVRPAAPASQRPSLPDHTISFVMPQDRVLDTLPRPTSRSVSFCVVPARRVAVVRFHGLHGGVLPSAKRAELLRLLRDAKLHARGEVTFAGYDAPWTAALLRRNEVMVEIEEDATRSPAARALAAIA